MPMRHHAGIHGGVHDQQAGCLPPETGPSMQDASEVQDEHGQDHEPGTRRHDYPKRGSGPTAIHSLPFRALAYPLDDDQDGDALTVAR